MTVLTCYLLPNYTAKSSASQAHSRKVYKKHTKHKANDPVSALDFQERSLAQSCVLGPDRLTVEGEIGISTEQNADGTMEPPMGDTNVLAQVNHASSLPRDYLGRGNASSDSGQDPRTEKVRQRTVIVTFLAVGVANGYASWGDLSVLIVDSDLGPPHGLFAAQLRRLGVGAKRIHSPNVDAAVVAASLAPPVELAFASEITAHRYLDAHADLIRAHHHLDVAFLDVHGEFENNARLLVQTLATQQLLRARSGLGAIVCFAVSDLPVRFRVGKQRAQSVMDIQGAVLRIFNDDPKGAYQCTPYVDDCKVCPGVCRVLRVLGAILSFVFYRHPRARKDHVVRGV